MPCWCHDEIKYNDCAADDGDDDSDQEEKADNGADATTFLVYVHLRHGDVELSELLLLCMELAKFECNRTQGVSHYIDAGSLKITEIDVVVFSYMIRINFVTT